MSSHFPILRMPTAFGPSPGPRQSCVPGLHYDAAASPLKTCAYAVVEAERESLAALLPAGFTLLGTPRIMFEYSALREIQWLAGRGYDMLTLRVPVRWTHRGQDFEGFFQPVCWENMADPIISGREELGWSKIFATMAMDSTKGAACTTHAEWEGFRFFELSVLELASASTQPPATLPVFHRKYLPSTQAWGSSDVDHITMTPNGGSQTTLLSHQRGRASLKFIRPSWAQMPTQHHIVNRLADIDLGPFLDAGVFVSRGGKDLSDQFRFV